jgi:ribonucleoside-diphosphate reductase alpha chain
MWKTTDRQSRRRLAGGCENRAMTSRGGGSAPIDHVRKRDGRLVPFDPERITVALFRAARESGRPDRALAEQATQLAVEDLEQRFDGRPPGIEEIQDAAEAALMRMGLPDVARRYVIYRRRRSELREAKQLLGVEDQLKLSLNAVAVLRERYLLRDDEGRLRESTRGMMERVARHVAAAEDGFVPGSSGPWEQRFRADGVLEVTVPLPQEAKEKKAVEVKPQTG